LIVRFTFGLSAMKSAFILLNAPVSDAAAKIFAEPDSVDTDADGDGEADTLGDTEGETDALGVADAEAVTVGVGVAVPVTDGVTVSVTVGVGVAEALGDELVFTLLPLQAVAIMAIQAITAKPYRNRAGVRMVPFLSSVGLSAPWATAPTEAR
jgi:hypothetical protein